MPNENTKSSSSVHLLSGLSRFSPEMSSSASSSHSDPDGIVVIEESDIVVLDEENSDTSSFQSAADSEIVVLENEEEDILDLDDEDGLNDDGLLVVRVRHSAGVLEEEKGKGNISNSAISGEVDKRSIDDGTPNGEQSHASTRASENSKYLEEEAMEASVPRASSGSLHPSDSSSVPSSEWCFCPSRSTAG